MRLLLRKHIGPLRSARSSYCRNGTMPPMRAAAASSRTTAMEGKRMPDGRVIRTPDFRTYPVDPRIVEANISGATVTVTWADGAAGCFHHVWLRDNCADERSIDPHSRERTFDFLSIPPSICPRRVGVAPEGALSVTWGESEFESLYHPGWLRAHCYSLGMRPKPRAKIETWDAILASRLPTFDWHRVSESETDRLHWLRTIERFGIAILTDGPSDPELFARWAETMFIIRDMNWGKFYDIIYDQNSDYIANKAIAIPPHSDGPTREYMPGIQIFQCVRNDVEGGDSYWCDAFHVAELLRRDHPDDFALLTTVPWPTANRHKSSEYSAEAPLIRLDTTGGLVEVRDTHWLREPLLADPEVVERVYGAYRRYAEMTRDPANHLVRRLAAGEISVIDNRRVLHARAAYVDGKGRRHMRLCYSEREELRSAIAVLERKAAHAMARESADG